MASIDGSRSYLAGSDEVIKHTCGPCKDDGEIKEAKYRCEICKIHLCFDCRNDHKTFKATKNHSIVSNQGTGSTSAQGTFAILCSCDQKRAVEVYCEKHAEVICPICETIKHSNCKICPIKDKATKDTKKNLKETVDKAKSLEAEIESCKQDEEANLKILDGKTEQCKEEVEAFRREINNILDNLEKRILENLDTNTNQQRKALEKRIAALTASLQTLNTDLEITDTANKTNRDEIMFSMNVKLLKSVLEYGQMILDIRNGMQKPELEFQNNTNLIDMLKSEEGLGRIEPSEAGSAHQAYVVILDMKVKSTKEVNIKLPDDNNSPFIIDSMFMSNGCILLCDHFNKKLKLLDNDMSIKKCLKLSEAPYNMAAIGENEVIISTMTNLQYIYTHPDLKLGKKITLPKECYGLQVVNEEIYTACHKDFGHDEIWKLDRAGNIIRKIVLTQSSSSGSRYLGLCLTGFNSRVYLTDGDDSRVTCFQLDGKIVYQYKDKEQLKEPNGIYVDSAGNSLVCGTDSDNVVVITADGRKHGDLLTPKDIRWPRCINYRPEDKTLIIGCCDNSKLFVYKLEK